MADLPRSDVILASSSPRRQELLSRLGIDFAVVDPGIDEVRRHREAPLDYVSRMAGEKCDAVAMSSGGAAVVAADTTVILDGEVLGQTEDASHARQILERLSGRTHEVATAVCLGLAANGGRLWGLEVAEVSFAVLQAEDIDWYVRTDEWRGKAGAYAIQGAGAVLVERMAGDPTTVIGLPLRLTRSLLTDAGVV